MISKVKAVLKLATAALLSCAATPLYAAEALHAAPVHKMGFTAPNQAPPFLTYMDMTQGAAGNGSLVFSLDLHFGASTPTTSSILPLIQYDSAKLNIIGIANVAHAGFFKPDPSLSRINDYKYKIAESSRKLAFADADTEFALVWADMFAIAAVSGATPEKPVRIATIKFEWLAGAAGNSQIAIIEAAAGVAGEHFDGTNISLRGSAIATTAVTPQSVDITVGETSVQVECSLSRLLPDETTCILGSAGNAMPGVDYTTRPAIEGARIAIPAGQTSSGPHTFTISPYKSGNEKKIHIVVRRAFDDDGTELRMENSASAPISLLSPDLSLPKTSITVAEEGGDGTFQVRLTAQPRGGDVVVNVRNTATSEASVSPKLLIFNAINWNKGLDVTVRPVDDKFADGDKHYKIYLAVDDDETGAALYHGKSAVVSATTADNDKVKATLTAEPDSFKENGGEQRIVITAKLSGAVFESDTRVTLRKAGGTARENTDYKKLNLPDGLIIPREETSSSLTFSIIPIPDERDEWDETIVITGAFDHPAINARNIALTIERDPDAEGNPNRPAQNAMMVARDLLGVSGPALVAGLSDANPTTVAARVKEGRDSLTLDVDKDLAVTGIDGILIVRYKFGMRGEALLQGLYTDETGKEKEPPSSPKVVETNIMQALEHVDSLLP